MRKILITVILIFGFQSFTKADDIRDFEIEGMSIGDSLLKFYSETEISNQLSKVRSTRKNNDIKRFFNNTCKISCQKIESLMGEKLSSDYYNFLNNYTKNRR